MGRNALEDDQIAQRRVDVADLHLNGWSARKIAKHMGLSHETIYEDIRAIRRQWIENQTSTYEERVAKELEYCDQLAAKYAHRVDTGDAAAGQLMLQVLNRRAKYLALDTPTRVVIDDQRLTALRELAERLGVLEAPEVKELFDANTV